MPKLELLNAQTRDPFTDFLQSSTSSSSLLILRGVTGVWYELETIGYS